MVNDYTCAVNPSQYMRMNYMNQVGLADMCDDTFMGASPMGMGGSLFSCGMPYGRMGMGMMGYGYGPGSEVMNMSQADYMKYQEQLENMQLDKKLNQHRKLEATEYAMSSPQDKITALAGVLQSTIRDNNQDNVYPAFLNLKEAVKEKIKEINPHATEEEIQKTLNSQAIKAYTEATGENLPESLKLYSNNDFTKGLIQGTGLGYFLTSKNTWRDNYEKISGEKVATSDKAKQGVGIAIGAILTTIAGVLLFRHGRVVTHSIADAIKGCKINIAERNALKFKSTLGQLESLGDKSVDLTKYYVKSEKIDESIVKSVANRAKGNAEFYENRLNNML